jgi:proteasome lid subunit RPN8/RPN11
VIERLYLPATLLAQIEDEARAASPRECCGLLVGQQCGDRVDVFLAHPAANVAERDDRFEIDPETQFALLRALRGTERAIVGCYHSHPDGKAEPSQTDADSAAEMDFLWLIVGMTQAATTGVNAFMFDGAKFGRVALHVALSEKAA